MHQGGSGSNEAVNCGPTAVAMAVNYSGAAAPSPYSVRATLDGASELLFRHHADNLRPWLVLGQETGYLNAALDADEMCEWLMRITLSLLTTDGPVERTPDQVRDYLKTYLTPVLAGPGPVRRSRRRSEP